MSSSITPISLSVQQVTRDVLLEKYAKGTEDCAEVIFERVARAIASAEAPALRDKWEKIFLENMHAGAVGAGRIMSAAGTDIQSTLINCFVQPVGDAIGGVDDDGLPGIYVALHQAAETMRRGGGVGYDFSPIRPLNAYVKGTHSMASGPCSYIDVYDASCKTVESAGARRGAQMGVLRITHPDSLDFITAKRTPNRWNNFNVSVGVPDSFLRAVEADEKVEMWHKARPSDKLIDAGAYQRDDGMWVYRVMRAVELWNAIMNSAYNFAEPGILFMDRINQDNNLAYCETINATNPCVTKDTWVMTSEGPSQVGKLIGKPFEAVVDGKCYPTQSEGFFFTGRKQVMRLRTREGHSLRLTPDHKIRRVASRTRDSQVLEWVATGDLKQGDRIVLHDHREMAGWGGLGTKAEGYLMGLLVGDGTLKSDKAVISVWGGASELALQESRAYAYEGAEAVMNAAESAASTLSHRSDFKGFQKPVAQRGEARMCSGAVRSLALSLGMKPGHKTITPAMEEGSSAFTIGLLRGLFDADGSVQGSQEKGVSVRLAQSDAALLQTVQRMLQRLGVVSSVYLNRREAQVRSMPNGKGGSALYETQANHELVIAGENLHRFAQTIGFEDSVKAARLATSLAAYRRKMNRERFSATVESITPEGMEDVYDVTVAECHAFDANGLYVHNCGEQPLPPYGCCDLGPLILTKFVRHAFGVGGEASFDFEAFKKSVAVQVRFLDNVLDVTYWPLPEQKAQSDSKRRIGVGFTGLGDTLVMLKLKYNSPEGLALAKQIAETMRDSAYLASIELSKEKGPFPLFDAEKYLAAPSFASRLPEHIKAAIREHGIHNSHLLSIAPVGTISLAFGDNDSNGVEPAFSWSYDRKKRMADGTHEMYAVEDHAYRLFRAHFGTEVALPDYFVSAMDMTAAEHIAMLETVQPFIDTSISKTVNVPVEMPFDDFKDMYMLAHKAGLKGLATYRPNDTLGSVLSLTPAPAPAPSAPTSSDLGIMALASLPFVDPMRAVVERRPAGQLPAVSEKVDYWTHEGKKSVYLIVSFMPIESVDGTPRERAIEVFMPVSQTGESQQWISTTMRMLSLTARSGMLDKALADMRKVAWDRGPVRLGEVTRSDGGKAPMYHDSEAAALAYAIQEIIQRRAQVHVEKTLESVEKFWSNLHPVADENTELPAVPAAPVTPSEPVMYGKKCHECGAHAVVKRDGCEKCTSCGMVGSCG